jgi:hypothetical protein
MKRVAVATILVALSLIGTLLYQRFRDTRYLNVASRELMVAADWHEVNTALACRVFVIGRPRSEVIQDVKRISVLRAEEYTHFIDLWFRTTDAELSRINLEFARDETLKNREFYPYRGIGPDLDSLSQTPFCP